MTTLLAYIPVLHQGYFQLFSEYVAKYARPTSNRDESETLCLIPAELAQQFGPIHKDIHALDIQLIKQAIESWQLFEKVTIVDTELLEKLNTQRAQLVIPDEAVTRQLVGKYLPNCTTTLSSIFLRWDKENAVKQHAPKPTETVATSTVDSLLNDLISSENFADTDEGLDTSTEVSEENSESNLTFMNIAQEEGAKSSDWWRRVGAVAVRDGKIIAQVHNTHLPSEQQPYIEGDGRAQFHKGDHLEMTTAIHAEAKLISEAAAQGISLAGADLYVTDFPCPNCAKIIAHAGFKRLFYAAGYSVFDGERVLKAAGVQIIKVG